ncbi:seryl-tRNA synthetase [Candidatus Nitrososphaera evergladensis SR1]|jgi:seryl-tRNA synthetase|uniref:Serine--tRNA ligase n=1 Tax=Candidatus Nitrososphaera evergladensis SR1 TaxID=1459636 RepID=A0A075MSR0_9ARCH|nr:serine--tRNA ligase [Candidatus Nitrososphaera evergladensis]AIF83817.1 seryl-tRNA synthetase [Candidatus Nitrososphaera evergladensis SR1]
MLDPKLLKDNPDAVHEMLNKRNVEFPLDELVALERRRRELITESQEYRSRKNKLSEAVAAKKKAKQDASAELEQMKEVGTNMERVEQEKVAAEDKYRKLAALLPNMLHESVPVGKDEKDNVVVKTASGKIRSIDKPKDHVDIATALDLFDIERAAKVSGARFYFLKNELVRMNTALVHFALDYLTEKGYTLVQPPYMIHREPMEGAVILGDFEDVIYKIENEDLYMIGTSEHAIAGMHMDEILEGKQLPVRYAGVSPCFRKEAGAHGKDMKGIFRVHQFEKVEQFVYCRPEDSWKEHEHMLEVSQGFFDALGIPYRVMLLCSGDTGKISAKTYDIEAWMPGQGAYREIVSCSNCTDYQARRLAIRFRDKTNEETRFVHTLNSTLVAVQRTLVAIMENYQTPSGTVQVPEVLQKYMGDLKEIKPKA